MEEFSVPSVMYIANIPAGMQLWQKGRHESLYRLLIFLPDFPGKIGEENQEPVQGFMASFLPKLHSGRNIRDIHDRWDREFFHGVSRFPSPYIYIA